MECNFRQNLRNELSFQDLTVKELSCKTGIPKPTLDCYLGARETMPPVDIAVRIANALNVSVEFLVNGKNSTVKNERKQILIDEINIDLRKLHETVLTYIHSAIHSVALTQEKNL